MKTLRLFQAEAKNTVFQKLSSGITRQLVVFATGLGKTVTAAHIISSFNRCLWVTHTEELILQSGEAVASELDLLSCGIIKAEKFDIQQKVTVASIQTLWRRLDKISADHFDVIVIDEAHYAMADTWQKAINHFTPKLLLGLTATPDRLDGLSLGNIFEEIVVEKDIKFGIDNEFLCELDAHRVKTALDIDKVKTTAGDLNLKDLKIIDTPSRNNMIVEKYQEYAKDRPAIIFCVDVEHAQHMAQAFQQKGISSSFVVGDEALCPDRAQRIADFKAGKIQVMANVMILTAGFDYPDVGCIITARPTKSKTVFLQQIGRGTRIKSQQFQQQFGNKCIILDIVDSTSRHSLINTWTLEKNTPINDRIYMSKQRKGEYIAAIDAKRKHELDHELKADVKINLLALPKYKVRHSTRTMEAATEKQIAYLKKLGIWQEGVSYSKGQCMELIGNEQASEAQKWRLKREGYDISNGVTIGEAQLAFKDVEAKRVVYTTESKFKSKSPFKNMR